MKQQTIERLSKHLIKNHEIYLDDEELESIASSVLDDLVQFENVGYFTRRLEFNPREKAFHDQWLEENKPLRYVNHGNGLLQDLFFDRDENKKLKCFLEINKRDREIVATVIQWLGTNIGFNFLETVLKIAGYKIEKIK